MTPYQSLANYLWLGLTNFQGTGISENYQEIIYDEMTYKKDVDVKTISQKTSEKYSYSMKIKQYNFFPIY